MHGDDNKFLITDVVVRDFYIFLGKCYMCMYVGVQGNGRTSTNEISKGVHDNVTEVEV